MPAPAKPQPSFPLPAATASAECARVFLVVEDHPLMADAVVQALRFLVPNGEIRTARTLREATAHLASGAAFAFTLFDLGLSDTQGYDGLAAVRELRPDVPVAVLSGDLNPETIRHCLRLGAAGYIPKTMDTEGIMDALRTVVGGRLYVPHALLAAPAGAGRLQLQTGSGLESLGLTQRQTEILRLILRGLPNKLICRELGLAEGTVKVHVSAALRVLGVRTRAEAVTVVSRLGLHVN